MVTPTDIEKKQYVLMHELNTFQPVGLNIEYPFSIPFLGQSWDDNIMHDVIINIVSLSKINVEYLTREECSLYGSLNKSNKN